MDIQTLTTFLMWCSIINGGLFALATLFLLGAPDLTYRLQNAAFPLPRDTYNVVIYSFLGLFKVVLLVFNLVPLVALLIIK